MRSSVGLKKRVIVLALVVTVGGIGWALFKNSFFDTSSGARIPAIEPASQETSRPKTVASNSGQINSQDPPKSSVSKLPTSSLVNAVIAVQGSNASLAAIRYGKIFHRYSEALTAIAGDPSMSEAERATARAQILLTCASIARKGTYHLPYISSSSPDADARHKAYEIGERLTRKDRCAGISEADYSEKSIREKWEAAAKLGDARARAAMIDYNLRNPENVAQQIKRSDGEPVLIYKGPSEAETQVLLAGLNSRDPTFMLSHGTLFSETFANVDFVFGPQGEKLGVEEFPTFWALVACQFGADCGTGNREVAAHCVDTGQCQYASYEEYLRATRVSAAQWEQFQRLIPVIVNAINTGDWVNAITRRSPPSGQDPIFYNQKPFNTRTLQLPG
jgi:hypothetical protein